MLNYLEYFSHSKCTIKIVQYVIISLKKPSPKLSRLLQVCLFYCRQLYSTAEGLLSLLQYDLHNSIVHCLDNIKDKEWRRKLINNLLNFASTPKVHVHVRGEEPLSCYLNGDFIIL